MQEQDGILNFKLKIPPAQDGPAGGGPHVQASCFMHSFRAALTLRQVVRDPLACLKEWMFLAQALVSDFLNAATRARSRRMPEQRAKGDRSVGLKQTSITQWPCILACSGSDAAEHSLQQSSAKPLTAKDYQVIEDMLQR